MFLQLSFPGLSFYVFLTFLLFWLQFQLLDELAPFLFYVGVFFSRSWRLHQLMKVESTCATCVVTKLCHYACVLIWRYIHRDQILKRYHGQKRCLTSLVFFFFWGRFVLRVASLLTSTSLEKSSASMTLSQHNNFTRYMRSIMQYLITCTVPEVPNGVHR